MTRNLDILQGEVLDRRVLGQDGWGKAEVRWGANGVLTTVVGCLHGVHIGDTITAHGCWSDHPKFGRQWKAKRIDVVLPQNASGTVAWLAARLPQLGRTRAFHLVERFGAGVFDVIENEPDRLLEVSGITPDRRDAIVEAYERHRADRDRDVTFKSWGLSDSQISRVLAKWGDDAAKVLREDPYRLCDEVHGFGFQRADALAQRMGLAADAPARLRAGVLHTLRTAASAGHLFLWSGALIRIAATKMLNVEPELAAAQLRPMARERRIKIEGGRIAIPELAEAERQVADALQHLMAIDKEAA